MATVLVKKGGAKKKKEKEKAIPSASAKNIEKIQSTIRSMSSEEFAAYLKSSKSVLD